MEGQDGALRLLKENEPIAEDPEGVMGGMGEDTRSEIGGGPEETEVSSDDGKTMAAVPASDIAE